MQASELGNAGPFMCKVVPSIRKWESFPLPPKPHSEKISWDFAESIARVSSTSLKHGLLVTSLRVGSLSRLKSSGRVGDDPRIPDCSQRLIGRSWLEIRPMFYWRLCTHDLSFGEGMRPLTCVRLCGRFALLCRWRRQDRLYLIRRLRGPNRANQSIRISTPPGMRFRDR